MKLSLLSYLAVTSALSGGSAAVSILMGNDDGFGSAQLREFYRFLKADGHDVVIVAPVDNESGQGGRADYSSSRNLTKASEFDLIPAGAPALGRDPSDPDIWYYNGTPAACTIVALDYVLPLYYDNKTIDLYVGGPNYGTNVGSFLYTLSGTMGGTYAAVGRGLPGIAFSGANSEQRSYTWINATTASGHPDPATIQGRLAADVVGQLVNGTKPGKRLMPVGYGLNVNTPLITSFTNDSCVAPPFIQTRFTGGGFTDSAVYNATTGTFHYGNYLGSGVNRCINGNCALPGETSVVNEGCFATVSVFTVDYDAPLGKDQTDLRVAMEPLVAFQDPTSKMAVKARGILTKKELEDSSPLRHE
ncbi:5'/3'-nucleotidase SurE [Phialophora macrospora]|uniref:5'/3'-nucleotidase SurE n=1 Tax=Phialophora macrospora TaxID=1851006 RepID=A0A0D2CBJ6_9EURO|nr:5'/3'-nucleotidase SurE [Phialophora macrospora]